MLTVGPMLGLVALFWLLAREGPAAQGSPRWRTASMVALGVTALLAGTATTASAAIVPTVTLATSSGFAVLAGSTVTNTGSTVLDGSLGLSPGTSITGFPPGVVLAPGTTEAATAAADQAQLDLSAAYLDAAGRPLDATTTSDLVGLTLNGGVYAGPGKSPLTLSGPLVLDGAGDPSSVFIFQTDSTLITASASTVTLVNGAQECNVFWQVGSSATLGTNSEFAGTILALTSITMTNNVTLHGRALARNGAVTLDTATFTRPTCATAAPVPTTTTATTTTAIAPVTTVAPATTTTSAGAIVTTIAGNPTSAAPGTAPEETTTTAPLGVDTTATDSTVPPTDTTPALTLPQTGAGRTARTTSLLALAALAVGALATVAATKRRTSPDR